MKTKIGVFVVEPLNVAVILTLGNSLRRVLLASYFQVQLSLINIEGVLHEFDTVESIEDVMQIILNVKGIAVKSYVQDRKRLE